MSVVDVIGHYQRSIEKCSGDPERLLHCMGKLFGLPISVHHLQTTGVGRTVNSLRKYEGPVGEAAKALVLKWKQMVTDEGSSEEENGEEEMEAEEDSAVETGEDEDEEEPEVEIEEKTVKSEEDMDDDEEEQVKPRKVEIRDENVKAVQREEEKSYQHHHHRHKSSHSERREAQQKSASEESRRAEGTYKSSHHESKREDKHSEKSHKEKHRKEGESKDRVKKEKKKREDGEKDRQREMKRLKYEEEMKRKQEAEKKAEEERRRAKEEARKRDEEELRAKEEEERMRKEEEEQRRVRKEEERRKQKEEERKRRKEEERKKLKMEEKKKHREKKVEESKARDKERKEEKAKEKRKEERMNGKTEKDNSRGEASGLKGDKPREDIPSKKKRKVVEMEDGSIDCGSGASFAEALGMVAPRRSKGSPSSPSKLKKKKKDHTSPLAKTSVSSSSSSSTSKSDGRSSQLTPKPAAELLSEKDFDILSPSAASRLEPLEVDIAATLPQTVPHYRPLPYPRLDYSPPRGNANKGMISEEEALSAIMNTKNQRTKVYSGSRSSFTYVPTLYEICIRLLQENIDALGQTGGVPFDLLKPVLERATPQQLLFLEDENPYLIEDTDGLWCFHCQKDFRNRERQEMESWREMYLRCSDEREAKLKALTANIQRSMVQAQMPVRRTKLAYVDTVAKPPRNVARTQAKYGTSRVPIKPLVKSATAGAGMSSPSTSRLASATASLAAGSTSPVSLSSAAASARIGVVATSINKKPKPAPLMQKTLKFMKGRFKR